MPEDIILIEDVTEKVTGSGSFVSSLNRLDGEEEHPEDDKISEYAFHFLEKSNFRIHMDRSLNMLFIKWGFGDHMQLGRFRFEQPIHTKEDGVNMIKSLMRSGELARHGVSNFIWKENNKHAPLELPIIREVLTSEIHMDLFQKLTDCGAVNEYTGHIKGRLDENLDNGILINSILRETLFMEESELWDTYSDKERNEFLFRIFKHLVIGGATNQYEDKIEDYLKVTKVVYRDFLNVKKTSSGDVEVTSWVYEVGHKVTDTGPSSAGHLSGVINDHPMSFSYFIIDPFQRYVTFWGFGYKSAWG